MIAVHEYSIFESAVSLQENGRVDMITVLASIHVRTGRLADFLHIFKDNMVEVRKEKGCIEYFPAIDIPVDLPSQVVDENVVTVLEKWDTMEALKAHLVSSHMQAYRVMVKDMIENVQLKILKEA